MKKLKLATMALVGVFFMPLLFSVPAHAAPADWNIVDITEGAACEFLEEEFSITAQDCDEGGITLQHSDFGADSTVRTDAVASQTWRSKYTVELDDDSELTRVQYGYVPVCHVNGAIHKAGDLVSFEAQVSDEDIQHEMALNPTWSSCGLGQEAALLQFSYMEQGLDIEEYAPYSPHVISAGAGDLFIRGYLTEYGIMYFYGSNDGTMGLIDYRKSSLEIAYPNFDFSDWIDIYNLTGTSTSNYESQYYAALNHNAEILYGENFVPATGTNHNARNMSVNVKFDGFNNITRFRQPSYSSFHGTPAYSSLPPGIDVENPLSQTCLTNSRESGSTVYRINPNSAVCNLWYVSAESGFPYESEFASPRLDTGDAELSSLGVVYRSYFDFGDLENNDTQTNNSIIYSLIEPSSGSLSGPIVQEEREPGIDEQEIEDAGGYTSIGDVYDAAVDGFPSVQWTDCDSEGLGWFSCFVALVQDVVSWVGDIFMWLFNLFIPTDLDYLAWVQAVYGGFENSDPYYYSVGTLDYIQSQFGGTWASGTFDGQCAPVETGFIDMDFCSVKDAPGYSIAMGIASAIIYVLGFITIFRVLYKFFAPKTDLSNTVSPSTAKKD